MCELKIVVDEAVVFENVVYAINVENKVVVKDILGNSKEFENHVITEVNIPKEQLILSPAKTQN
ncbi:CooT family nickel-binding protein [Thermoproteota archaeon]